MTETNTETVETEETPEVAEEVVIVPDESLLNDMARMVLATVREQAAAYNSRQAILDASTGDRSKAVHELRESSDDPKVVKLREWLAKSDATREKAITDVDAYISENLLPSASLTAEEAEAEKDALKVLKKDYTEGAEYFVKHATRGVEGAENLLPVVKGARRGVAKGTGTGTAKPRITGIYIDGALQAHPVKKDGKETGEQKSTFTDAVKYLSDTHKVKVETSDIHAAYFAAAGVDPSDVSSAPDKVEFVFHVTDKDGQSINHNLLVTK